MSTSNIKTVTWPKPESIAGHRVLAGSPEASTMVLHQDARSELGLWKISAGEFTTLHQGYTEFFTVVEGQGRLVQDTGATIELKPETVVVLEDGWTGRWVVEQSIVKSYAIIPTQP